MVGHNPRLDLLTYSYSMIFLMYLSVCVQCVLIELSIRLALPSTCMQVQSQSIGLQFQLAP